MLPLLYRYTIRLYSQISETEKRVSQIGPGIVNLEWESALFGNGAFLQVVTPVEPLTQRMIHHVYCQRWLPTIVAKFFLYAEALMVRHEPYLVHYVRQGRYVMPGICLSVCLFVCLFVC